MAKCGTTGKSARKSNIGTKYPGYSKPHTYV